MPEPVRNQWFYERPTATLMLAPNFLVIGFAWAYLASSMEDLFELWRTESERDLTTSELRMMGVLFGHPWVSLVAGLIWGFIFGLWDKQRTDKNIDSRASTLYREALGHRFAGLLSPMPGALMFGVLALCPVILIIAIPIAAKPFMFAGAAAFLIMVYPAERRAFHIAESRLKAEEMDVVTRKRVERWRRAGNFAPVGLALVLVVTIAVAFIQIRLGHSIDSMRVDMEEALTKAKSPPEGADRREFQVDDR